MKLQQMFTDINTRLRMRSILAEPVSLHQTFLSSSDNTMRFIRTLDNSTEFNIFQIKRKYGYIYNIPTTTYLNHISKIKEKYSSQQQQHTPLSIDLQVNTLTYKRSPNKTLSNIKMNNIKATTTTTLKDVVGVKGLNKTYSNPSMTSIISYSKASEYNYNVNNNKVKKEELFDKVIPISKRIDMLVKYKNKINMKVNERNEYFIVKDNNNKYYRKEINIDKDMKDTINEIFFPEKRMKLFKRKDKLNTNNNNYNNNNNPKLIHHSSRPYFDLPSYDSI